MSRLGDFFRALARNSETENEYDSAELDEIKAITAKDIAQLEKQLQVESEKPVVNRVQKTNKYKNPKNDVNKAYTRKDSVVERENTDTEREI